MLRIKDIVSTKKDIEEFPRIWKKRKEGKRTFDSDVKDTVEGNPQRSTE